jgi:hypothetical protein
MNGLKHIALFRNKIRVTLVSYNWLLKHVLNNIRLFMSGIPYSEIKNIAYNVVCSFIYL